MKCVIVATLSVATLFSLPALALNDRFDSERQQTMNKLNKRFDRERQQILNK